MGSVIIALDKVVPLSALDSKSFAPVGVELPLWHDTDESANERLQALGCCMKIGFKYAEHQPEGMGGDPLAAGPRTDSNLHQSMAIMTAGAEFLKYPFGSSGAPQKRFVWYDKNDGPMGTLYWNDPGKKKKKRDKSIPLHSITGLFEQNQTNAFRKHRLGKERMGRCFSVVGRDRTLDLEARSKELVDAFLTGIHRILSASGWGVKEVSAAVDADEALSQPVVKNTFVIKAKLRNLPPMPWSSDERNDTIICMEERLPSAPKFKAVDQTDWQKSAHKQHTQRCAPA